MENKMDTLEDLVRIIRILRGENGCPWDRVQTHASIRMDMLEEAYEAADAIDKKDMKNLCEELGPSTRKTRSSALRSWGMC